MQTYDYGKAFNQATKNVILNLNSLREEKKNQDSTKTKYLFKSEFDATTRMLIQWVNFISRGCLNNLKVDSDENSIENNSSFNFLLPKHEQIFELMQLNNGKTISRLVFYLIYCGVRIEGDPTSSTSTKDSNDDNNNSNDNISNNNNNKNISSIDLNDDNNNKNNIKII